MKPTRSFWRDIVTVVVCALVVVASSGLFNFRNLNHAYAAAAPELPRVYLDSTYPSLPASRTVRNAKLSCSSETNCYTSLQSAINASSPGDEVVLQAGTSYTGPITLPAKSCSFADQTQCYIVIRTSNIASLPEGRRVSPSDAANMAKIVAPGSNEPALETAAGAHHYRIVGIEFAKASASTVTDTLILSGDGSSAQNNLSLVPHDLVYDRIYVHGDPTSDLKRGLGLNSASTSIVDSYFSDLHVVGVDAQAVGGWNGPGPFKIYNNYMEGAAENFLFGGSDPSVPNLVPSDLDFEYNYLYKPRSWRVGDPSYAGKHWSVKNLFELKNSQRALIQNNIFDGSWADGQSGYAILFTVRDSNGTCSWCIVSDVTFKNNIVRHAAAGFQILGHDDAGGPSQLTQRIQISNNLWSDINGPTWGGNGWWMLLESGTAEPGPSDVELSHNTVDQTGNIMTASPYINPTFYTKPNFVVKDNIVNHNSYGVIGDNSGVGNNTLDLYFPAVAFTKNALIGGPANSYSKYTGNYFPANASSILVNEAGGDYHVLSTSAYHNAASDGTDLGANIDLIATNTSNVVSGSSAGISPSPTPTPTPTPSPAPSPTPTPTTAADVVIYAADVPDSSIYGSWSKVADSSAASGIRLYNPDAGAAKITPALVSPTNYFDMTFNASAGTPYHIWLRMKADADSFSNDSLNLQFSDALDQASAAAYQIGTTSSLPIVLEEGSGAGESGWGWNDNNYGSIGTPITFASSGVHTLRIQQREDGISVDQIVLSPATYLNSSPGALKNDTVIVPKPITITPAPTPSPTPAPAPASTPTPSPSPSAGGVDANPDQITVSAGSYPDGLIFKYPSDPTVYVLENGEKRPITDYSVLHNRIPSTRPVVTVPDSITFPTGAIVTLRSGSLVKGSTPTIYLVNGTSKYVFSSMQDFTSRGYSLPQVQTVDDNSVSALTTTTTFNRPSGTLFKYANSPTVYFLENGTKRAFPSLAVYKTWYDSLSRVVTIPATETYSDGAIVQLPNGILVRGSKPTVYLVSAGALKPFTSSALFLAQGYKFEYVVTVSDADLALQPVQP